MTKHLEKNTTNKCPLKLLIISDKTNKDFELEEVLLETQKYFHMNWTYLPVTRKSDLDNIEIPDIVFIDYKPGYEKIFTWELYDYFHRKNQIYLQIALLNQFSKRDFNYFRMGNDDIIYKENDGDFLKWKMISILRRSWDSHGKKTVVIHKGMLLDNIKNVFYFNDVQIHLTKKELQLMNLLMNDAVENYITKQKLFSIIWNDNGEDSTRVVDQMIFKIKKKVGKEVFEITKKGIKIL